MKNGMCRNRFLLDLQSHGVVNSTWQSGEKRVYFSFLKGKFLSGLHAHFLFFLGGLFLGLPPLSEIEQLARKITESEGLELMDLEYKTGQSRSLLRIFIDKNGGVTLHDCENVSRQLSAVLDVNDLVKGAYVLEVSSPGVDRPLRTDHDYQRSVGRTVRISYEEDGKILQIMGLLKNIDPDFVTLQHDGSDQQIRRDQIKRAQQEIPMPSHPLKRKKKRK
jgi:ribosome maturation factor RimP